MKKLLPSVLTLSIAACAPHAPKPHSQTWRRAAIHKVVVLCLQNDPEKTVSPNPTSPPYSAAKVSTPRPSKTSSLPLQKSPQKNS